MTDCVLLGRVSKEIGVATEDFSDSRCNFEESYVAKWTGSGCFCFTQVATALCALFVGEYNITMILCYNTQHL